MRNCSPKWSIWIDPDYEDQGPVVFIERHSGQDTKYLKAIYPDRKIYYSPRVVGIALRNIETDKLIEYISPTGQFSKTKGKMQTILDNEFTQIPRCSDCGNIIEDVVSWLPTVANGVCQSCYNKNGDQEIWNNRTQEILKSLPDAGFELVDDDDPPEGTMA